MMELRFPDIKKLQPLFAQWEDTMVWSALQGCMGRAWADNADNPRSGQIFNADFCFFAGTPSAELIRNRQEKDFVIMVPPDAVWVAEIEHVYGSRAKRVIRYALRKEPDVFDRRRLSSLLALPGTEYTLHRIDRELFEKCLQNSWSADFCSQFADYEDFQQHGLGVVALQNGALIAGASSYTYYHDGIEIEVDTERSHRRQGLAAACSAKLILACLDRGLYPSWDAQNTMSLGLAEKLGYHFSNEYPAYEITTK